MSYEKLTLMKHIFTLLPNIHSVANIFMSSYVVNQISFLLRQIIYQRFFNKLSRVCLYYR
jgi:hypothetical protein